MSFIENIKSVVKMVQQMDNIPLRNQILELQTDAMELIQQNSDLQERNRGLQDENRELREKFRLAGAVRLGTNSYWLDKDGEQDGPFCTRCWDKEKIMVRLTTVPQTFADISKHICPECKSRVDASPPKEKSQ